MLARHAVWVEGVPHIDHKFHVSHQAHPLVHGLGNRPLAPAAVEGACIEEHLRVPAPVSDHQEGPLPCPPTLLLRADRSAG
eukprot:CAMPEP_0179179314 /NCGR_PEP_ID=MMETSP0796-20121207/88739_1 /TAXON_ID=73915 /ORGANISM="Pyrodinium bahamense, Strain pbaha01" /LENGTH=80 /DNA_ID=CAMNT_0020882967 /DNA_START=179 /DNA_END=417 /DNA_ORIENTATION=-